MFFCNVKCFVCHNKPNLISVTNIRVGHDYDTETRQSISYNYYQK